MKMMQKYFKRGETGFSLIELMIVIAIVALLVALAIPSYKQFVRKSNRGESQQLLMNWANLQEIWRSNDVNYATTGELAVPNHDLYTFTLAFTCPDATTNQATCYLLTATAQGDQALDKDQAQSCTVLTVNQSNTKSHALCW